ncbi:MAG: methyltransferase domain-containing protein [Pseudomonadota bacterium]
MPKDVEQELVDRLSIVTMDAQDVLVLGVAHPETLAALARRFDQAAFVVADCSSAMLAALERALPGELRTRVTTRCIDHDALPFKRDTFDLLFSSFYLPLYDELNAVFASWQSVLRADGCAHFSTLGPDTFRELRAAWQAADPENPYHAIEPLDMHDVGDGLVHAGFKEPVMDRDSVTITYSDAEALLRDLRCHTIGNGFSARAPGMMGRRIWRNFVAALETARLDGRVSLSVEIVMGHAWCGQGASQRRREDGTVDIAFDSVVAELRKGKTGSER